MEEEEGGYTPDDQELLEELYSCAIMTKRSEEQMVTAAAAARDRGLDVPEDLVAMLLHKASSKGWYAAYAAVLTIPSVVAHILRDGTVFAKTWRFKCLDIARGVVEQHGRQLHTLWCGDELLLYKWAAHNDRAFQWAVLNMTEPVRMTPQMFVQCCFKQNMTPDAPSRHATYRYLPKRLVFLTERVRVSDGLVSCAMEAVRKYGKHSFDEVVQCVRHILDMPESRAQLDSVTFVLMDGEEFLEGMSADDGFFFNLLQMVALKGPAEHGTVQLMQHCMNRGVQYQFDASVPPVTCAFIASRCYATLPRRNTGLRTADVQCLAWMVQDLQLPVRASDLQIAAAHTSDPAALAALRAVLDVESARYPHAGLAPPVIAGTAGRTDGVEDSKDRYDPHTSDAAEHDGGKAGDAGAEVAAVASSVVRSYQHVLAAVTLAGRGGSQQAVLLPREANGRPGPSMLQRFAQRR